MTQIHAGPIRSKIPGRTDRIPMTVAANSYVIPADIVSGEGEGNTEAGYRKIEEMFGPPVLHGGEPGTDIIAAGGEYVLTPAQVAKRGRGDLKRGHDEIDKWVKDRRATLVGKLKSLPGPKKS